MPLAAFGLSAFFFSRLSAWLFPGNTESFLLMLAVATSGIIFLSFFFCRSVPVAASSYAPVPNAEPDNNRLHRTKSGESRHSGRYDEELGTSTTSSAKRVDSIPNRDANPDETSSLFSKSSGSSDEQENVRDAESHLIDEDPAVVAGEGTSVGVLDGGSDVAHSVHHVDIRGWTLLRTIDFWLLFTVLGTFTGVGLMTIKYV